MSLNGENSSPSPTLAGSSTENESALSNTLSFAPEGGYQSVLRSEGAVATPRVQGPGKLVHRRKHSTNHTGEHFELEHRNGDAHLKNGESYDANGRGHMDNGEAHSKNGDIQVGLESHSEQKLESASERSDRLATKSEPSLLTNHMAGLTNKENGRNGSHYTVVGSERGCKLEQEVSGVGNNFASVPRQLLATTSAPVRMVVHDLRPSHQNCHPESRENGSEGSSPHSSKSDLQSLSDQTGGATCGSGGERSLIRTKSLPSRSFSEVEEGSEYRRSNTQGRGHRTKPKSLESRNVRLVAHDKLSDRKKKKLMKNLATIQKDGTVEFDVVGSVRIASNLFGPGIFDEGGEVGEEELYDDYDEKSGRDVPPLQIVMLIVGTRGDVQPFVAIGKHLQEYGHRVRLATHTNFREFVLTAGLEFYPLGGDPKVLAGYMVKNKGFLPSGPGEIQVQRKQIKAIINSLLPACTAADTECGSGVPFRAQAIIANPPAYGHVHVAEYLQVPLHIFFTMPWTATSQFPHPLSRVKSPAGYRMSYQVVDSLIWWGIRSMINDFRKKKLKLRPITYLSGSQGSISELPTGYIWSPHLVPKPRDWGPLVDVVGFCFLNLAQDYKPPKDLLQWLKAGPAPIYVGFGSLPVVDPKGMTDIIVKALSVTQQRGIIFKGWGGMGELKDVPENIFLIEDCPHDWLFKQCAAVVHHGGAGTTAAGLMAACPTTVVPFFGDQPFWGEQIHAKGIGPPPIYVDQFSLDKLVKAIEYMLKDEVKERALGIAKAMEKEDGVEGAVLAFHKHLPRNTPQPAHTHAPDKLRSRVFKPLRIFASLALSAVTSEGKCERQRKS